MPFWDLNWAYKDQPKKWFKGQLIGKGTFRKVFVAQNNPRLVLKVALNQAGQSHNVLEVNNWLDFRKTKFARWFAPIVFNSEDYKVLAQVRALPIEGCKPPVQVPEFFTDVRPWNWGWYGDQPVCVDYAYLRLAYLVLRKVKMRSWRVAASTV